MFSRYSKSRNQRFKSIEEKKQAGCPSIQVLTRPDVAQVLCLDENQSCNHGMAVVCVTVRWSNFDCRDPKLGAFLQSKEATPCGHLLK